MNVIAVLLGIQVNCSAAICDKPEGAALIRHLILCFSGDHNGLCEAGKFVKMGKCGCRRCHVASKNKASVIDIVMRNLWFITICNSFIYVNIVKLNYFMCP